jgi:glucokinase
MVFDAAAKGDLIAKHLVDQLIRYASIGISQLINILDIKLIIMGGGLTKAGPEFISRINEETKKHLFNAEAANDIMIIKETLPNSALFGAAANVFMQCGDLDKVW